MRRDPEREKYQSMGNKDAKSRMSNFWYYYKWYFLIGIVVAAVIAFSVGQCASNVQPDYLVLMSTVNPAEAQYEGALQTQLTRYGEDINHDGKVTVEIMDASYNATNGDPQVVEANMAKLVAQLSSNDCILLITDATQFSMLKQQNVLQSLPFLKDQDGYAFDWKGSPLYEASSQNVLPEDLYFSIRVVSSTNATAAKNEAAAEALLQRVINNQPLTSAPSSSGVS